MLTNIQFGDNLGDVLRTVSSINPMDIAKIAVIVVAIWAALKIASKIAKTFCIVFIAFIIWSYFF